MNLVNIVVAVYKPNAEYFKKLLDSLNNQTYNKIAFLFRDDSDDEEEHKEITKMIQEKITKFEYCIYKNECNLGSNKTFELLTKSSTGEFIAYCDQDDIWEKDKIARLLEHILKENAVLCYSNLSIIDDNDNLVACSFKDVNKRVKHMYGENLFSYFLRRNSVTGCTMLIKADVAKKAIPFCHKYYVHDHWLTLYASTQGTIAYLNKPLVKYRIHDNNQIGASMLVAVNSREDYINNKLLKENNKYEYLLKEFKFNKIQREKIQAMKNWTERRKVFFEKKSVKNTYFMVRSLREDWQLIIFELFINFAPDGIVKKVFSKIKS
ncbi:glycosyltransferase [Alkalicoccus urumqiensis]|nr:glycosyltransferase [Alkalicoccus urumqiensis]